MAVPKIKARILLRQNEWNASPAVYMNREFAFEKGNAILLTLLVDGAKHKFPELKTLDEITSTNKNYVVISYADMETVFMKKAEAGNEDKVGIFDASGNIVPWIDKDTLAVKDGTLQENLNADKVDGKDVNDAEISANVLWTSQKIKQYVDSRLQGLDWQESVIARVSAPPASPQEGDRYIVLEGATGDFAGHENEIAEWDGTQWTFTEPDEGTAVWVESEDKCYVFNGTDWVVFSSVVNHEALNGLLGGAPNEHYHLTEDEHNGLVGGADAGDLHNHDGRYYRKGEVDTLLGGKVDKLDPTYEGNIVKIDAEGNLTETAIPADEVAVKDGSLQTNLNADMLDGKHANDFALADHTHTFLQLTDTPNSYTGQAGKVLRVSPGEDGIIFDTVEVTDEKVKASASDTETGYLIEKMDGNFFKLLDASKVTLKEGPLNSVLATDGSGNVLWSDELIIDGGVVT